MLTFAEYYLCLMSVLKEIKYYLLTYLSSSLRTSSGAFWSKVSWRTAALRASSKVLGSRSRIRTLNCWSSRA